MLNYSGGIARCLAIPLWPARLGRKDDSWQNAGNRADSVDDVALKCEELGLRPQGPDRKYVTLRASSKAAYQGMI
jgi:hypothetical protein